jgi:hypothetical protein
MPDLDLIKQGEQAPIQSGSERALTSWRSTASTGGFLAGRAEDIIEQLKAVEKRYPGLDRVICATPLGTPLEVQLEDLDECELTCAALPEARCAGVAVSAFELPYRPFYSAGPWRVLGTASVKSPRRPASNAALGA